MLGPWFGLPAKQGIGKSSLQGLRHHLLIKHGRANLDVVLDLIGFGPRRWIACREALFLIMSRVSRIVLQGIGTRPWLCRLFAKQAQPLAQCEVCL